MKALKFTCTLFILVLTTSCSYLYNQPEDLNQNKMDSSFVVGKLTDSLIVTTFDSVLLIYSYNYSRKYYQLDIDNDNEIDFEISSQQAFSSGGIASQRSEITAINDSVFISTEAVIDTTYQCTVQKSSTFIEITTYSNSSTYSCAENGQNIISTIMTNLYPKVYSINDTLNRSIALWSNGKLTLCFHNTSSSSNRQGNITTDYQKYIENGLWNNTDKKYLLFKIIKGGEIHYGWIQLGISDYTNIYLYQYACQK